MRPAVFLDRDGVLIANIETYVRSWEQVEIFPYSAPALRQISEAGFATVVVTNQSIVGRGIMSFEDIQRLHFAIMAEILEQGGVVDASYICPHGPEDECACRKPKPGMLTDAARDLGLDLAKSFMIGDALTDMQAAEAAGVKGILVRTGRGEEQSQLERDLTFPIVSDLEKALALILTESR